jgi:hypothetical protein
MNLVTTKVGAKHELLFNEPASAKLELLFYKPEAGLLNKCSCLARALGVIKFINMGETILVPILKSDLDVQQTHLSFNGKVDKHPSHT